MESAFSVNENLFKIEFNSVPFDLTPHEYDLLAVLMQESRRVVGRPELLRRVWVQGKPLFRVVDTYICRLRAKLQCAGHPGIGVAPGIGAARKRGYRLIPLIRMAPLVGPLAAESLVAI